MWLNGWKKLPIINTINNCTRGIQSNDHDQNNVFSKRSFMNCRIRYFYFFLLAFLSSCSKTAPAPSYPAYYGNWQYIGSIWGPFHKIPPADSTVVLTFNSGNIYSITLNGTHITWGPFTVDSIPSVTLTFVNDDKPFGNNTSGFSNGVYYLYFNTQQIGPLELFQTNEPSFCGDSLILITSPLTPDPTVNYFKRIP